VRRLAEHGAYARFIFTESFYKARAWMVTSPPARVESGVTHRCSEQRRAHAPSDRTVDVRSTAFRAARVDWELAVTDAGTSPPQ
jgi:hypothetical protein